MIKIKTRFSEKDIGLTCFGLNQWRVAEQFISYLEADLIRNGIEVAPDKRIGWAFTIEIDSPVIPAGQTVTWATGVLQIDPSHGDLGDELAKAHNRWGHASCQNWKDVQPRPIPRPVQGDLRIAPFFLDSVGAQVCGLRLEKLAQSYALVLSQRLVSHRVRIADINSVPAKNR